MALFVSLRTIYTGAIATLGLFGFPSDIPHVYAASLLIAGTIGLYSVMGGITAVVVTAAIQTAMISGQLMASCLWAFTSIGMLQCVLGARDLSHARKGMLLGAGLKLLGLLTSPPAADKLQFMLPPRETERSGNPA